MINVNYTFFTDFIISDVWVSERGLFGHIFYDLRTKIHAFYLSYP